MPLEDVLKHTYRRKPLINILLIVISLVSLTLGFPMQTWGGTIVNQTTIRLNGNFTIHAGSADVRVAFYQASYFLGKFKNQSALFLITSMKLTNLATAQAELSQPENVQLIAQSGKTYLPDEVAWPPSVPPGQTYLAEFAFMLSLGDQAKEIDWSYQGEAIVFDLTNTQIATTSNTETWSETVTSQAVTSTSSISSQTATTPIRTTTTSSISSRTTTTTSTSKTTTSGSLTKSTISTTKNTLTASAQSSQTGNKQLVSMDWWMWAVIGFLLLPLVIIAARRRKHQAKPDSAYHVNRPRRPPPAKQVGHRPQPRSLQEWSDIVTEELNT